MAENTEGLDALDDLKEWYENLEESGEDSIYQPSSENSHFAVADEGEEEEYGKATVTEYLDTRNQEGDFYTDADPNSDAVTELVESDKTELEQSSAGRWLKPGGHLNKPLIGVGALVLLSALFIIFGPSNSTEDKVKTPSKAEKLPQSKNSEELTGVTPGSTDGSNGFGANGNSNSQSSILGGDSNSNANSNPLLANGNTSQSNMQPVTKTTEVTTIQPVDANGQPIQQPSSSSVSNPTRPIAPITRQASRENISNGFTVDLGEENNRQIERPVSETSRVSESDTPVTQLKIAPGSKIEMTLDEPFRSGIESKVQATSLNNIKGVDGRILVSANSKFELTFRPEEIQGRVLARPVIRVFLSNGSIGEIVGMVKGKDGYAGIGGKLTKQDGRGLSGSIIGGIARVGGRILGGAGMIGSEIGGEIQNSEIGQDTQIYRSNRVVEVSGGTRFVILIGTPD